MGAPQKQAQLDGTLCRSGACASIQKSSQLSSDVPRLVYASIIMLVSVGQ